MTDKLIELENQGKSGAYYWASDIPKLIGANTPSFSSFRRRVQEGKIGVVDVGGREIAYRSEDVKKFLNGDFSLQRGGVRKSGAVQTHKKHQDVISNNANNEQAIDIARSGDLLHLYFLETGQLDYMQAIVPPVLHAWTQVNELIYWFLYNPNNRSEVLAMLGILPLHEVTIKRLMRGEMSFAQIPAEEIQTYHPALGKTYHGVIVSAAARKNQQDMILPLIKRAFSDWSKQSIYIESLYALMSGRDDDSPLARIVASCAFVPQDEEGKQWRLQPFYRRYQPATYVKEYRDRINDMKSNKGDKNMLLLEEEKKVSITDLRRLFEEEKNTAEKRDFTEIVLKHFVIEENGRLTRTDHDLGKQRRVYVRPIKSNEDLRATLDINASLFGSSQKYTVDQLIELRLPWIQKNPDIYRVLEVDGEVRGFLFVMPLPQPIIDRILTGEMKVGDVSPDDLRAYRPGESFNLYLQTLGVHKSIQDVQKRISGMYLLAGMHKLFVDLAQHGIELGAVYTRSNEIDGIKVAAALDMDEITVPGVDDKLVLKLDFTIQDKKSLHAYREALEQYKSTVTK